MMNTLPDLLWLIAVVVVVGVPLLFLWGAVRNHRELRALRSRARGRGYHAESAARYRGQDGRVAWVAQTLPHDPLGVGMTEANVYLPSCWHFSARWLPTEALLGEAVQPGEGIADAGAPVLEAGGVWIRLRRPAHDDAAPWQEVSESGSFWWRGEGSGHGSLELLQPVLDWMRTGGVDELRVQWTGTASSCRAFRRPTIPTRLRSPASSISRAA